MNLFRHLAPEHADEALRDGRLRIGTLGIYTELEEAGEARLDKMEGKAHFVIKGPVEGAAVKERKFMRDVGVNFIGGSLRNENPKGVAFLHEEAANDAYILSLSKETNPTLRKKFGGSGFEILDADAFVQAIGKRLFASGLVKSEAGLLAEITYKPKVENYIRWYGNDLPLWRTKPSDLGYECEMEVRAMWVPAKDYLVPPTVKSEFVAPPPRLEPTFVNCPELTRLIKALG